LLKSHGHALHHPQGRPATQEATVGYNGRNRGFRRISPIGRKGVAAGRTALSSPDGCKGGTARDWTEVVAGSFIRGSTLAHICYRARSATAKNSAMAIAAGLIWRAIFAFIGIRFTFSFGKFFPTLQNFRNQNFCRGLQGSRHGQKEKETAEQDRPYRAVAPATAH